jgi:hypothetical protein
MERQGIEPTASSQLQLLVQRMKVELGIETESQMVEVSAIRYF